MRTTRWRRFGMALATSLVLAAITWLAVAVDDPSSSTSTLDPTTAEVMSASTTADRAVIARGRAEARTRVPDRPVVLPPDPPPVGVPAWVRPLPNQPAYRVPVPRGRW